MRKKSAMHGIYLMAILAVCFSCTKVVSQPVVNKLDMCLPQNKRYKPFYIKKNKFKARFRLYNNSNCVVLVPTSEFLRSKNGTRLKLIPNGANFRLSYFIDSKWGFGHVIPLYPLSPRRYLVFSIPVSRIMGAKSIEIPIKSLTDDDPILSEETRRIKFSLINSRSNLGKISKK
jgi:hypothetical protein